MSPVFTLDASEAQSDKPVDPGNYEALIESVSAPQQGAKAAYVTTIFVVQDEPFVGRKIYHNTPINGKGAGMFCRLFTAATGEDLDVDDLTTKEIDTDDMVGNNVNITVVHGEYQGEPKHEIKKISAA